MVTFQVNLGEPGLADQNTEGLTVISILQVTGCPACHLINTANALKATT